MGSSESGQRRRRGRGGGSAARLFPQDFIKKHVPELGANFEVKYTSGAPPKLRFTNASGPSDVIRIDNWKTADMLAYVQEKLLSS